MVKETYSNVDNTSEVFGIKSVLYELRQRDMSVTDYFNALTCQWQQLDILEEKSWKCSEDSQQYKKIVEKDRVYQFLLGLNKDLDNMRGRILSIKPLPSVKEVFLKVHREESRKKLMLGSQHPFLPVEIPQIKISSRRIDQYANTVRKLGMLRTYARRSMANQQTRNQPERKKDVKILLNHKSKLRPILSVKNNLKPFKRYCNRLFKVMLRDLVR